LTSRQPKLSEKHGESGDTHDLERAATLFKGRFGSFIYDPPQPSSHGKAKLP
jgi:hypothetical protein